MASGWMRAIRTSTGSSITPRAAQGNIGSVGGLKKGMRVGESMTDFDYESLLDRARDKIPEDISSRSRWTLPEPDVLIEGSQTILRNFNEMVSMMDRDADHVYHFLQNELGTSGTRELVVVPISFVSEHIETLQEIDIEYRQIAKENGIVNFRRVRALDTYPAFIEGLSELVLYSLKGPEISLDEAASLPSGVKLYPQEKWQWGWNNSSEVWNGRVAMILFLEFFVEIILY